LTDQFHRRAGAFRDNLIATERLLDAGMIPRWQVFLTKPALGELEEIVRLVDETKLRGRVAELAGEFDIFCHPPGPEGESWDLEDVRIEQGDLERIPEPLLESTRKHFGGTLDWLPESVIVERVLDGMEIPPYAPDETWFFVNAELDVFSNYFGEMDEYGRLGNLRTDAVATMMEKFEDDSPPGLHATFHASRRELAERFGRRDSQRLYAPADLLSRWIHLSVRQ